MELKISPTARDLRENLLRYADATKAIEVAERIATSVVEQLNASNITAGTHLLATALIARANVQTAADWMAGGDIITPPPPTPEAWAAMLDLAVNLPPWIDGATYDARFEDRPD